MATVAYPSGLSLAYSYNAYGYQSQITDGVSGQVYWTANARDQLLHLITETAGNGVVTTRTFSPQTGWVSTIQAGSSAAVANFELPGHFTN